MTSDKNTIGLTPEAEAVIQQALESGIFAEQQDVAKLAMAYAINKGVEPSFQERATTKWNIGSFDPAGELKNVVLAVYPNVSTPYRAIEYLLNKGLELMGENIEKDGRLDINEYL